MTSESKLPTGILWGLLSLCVVYIAVLCTSPIKDGDIWWQMAYGKYAIDNATLIADHGAFTWTPTDGGIIYCCWLAQIFLFFLHSIGGAALLFAFKYSSALLFLATFLDIARREKLLRNPLVWALWLTGMAMANHSGATLKPEIFSFIGMIALNYLWYRVRLSPSKASKLPYFFPLIMLIWANSHGGVIFGAIFVSLMWLGEVMNSLFSRSQRLPIGTRRHLFIGSILSAAALFITPYGADYPRQLGETLLGSSVEELKTISDYQTAFSSQGKLLHLPEFFFLGASFLAILLISVFRRQSINWVFVLTNLFFGFLYCYMLRTTYFWGVTLAFTSVYTLSFASASLRSPTGKLKLSYLAAPLLISAFVSITILREKTSQPVLNRWFGYGMSMTNPVEEAHYIRDNLSGFKLGNDYDSGAYLLWTLYPDQKHMIDPRYFPFKTWYAEYYNALKGNGTQQFVSKMNCDVWCIGFLHREAVDWFQKSTDWKPLFYGARAVVFGRKDLDFENTGSLGGEEIENIRISGRALHVLTFAININDWENANRIYRGAKNNFPEERAVRDSKRVLEGLYAYNSRDFESAASYLNIQEEGAFFRSNGILLKTYLQLTVQKWNEKSDTEAFTYAQAALLTGNKDILAHYNYGVLGGYLSSSGLKPQVAPNLPSWEESLGFFLENYQKVGGIPSQTADIARSMLGDGIKVAPSLMNPSLPPEDKVETFKQLLIELREE
ncbi:MAG: hypothetical protein CMO61_04920 [Verrucomicrobiales bacterium]|nr:hypothetical protein [Verrucomicrobiales bacterium]